MFHCDDHSFISMLDPFAQLLQQCWDHACTLLMVSKVLWVVSFPQYTADPNIDGSCCICLLTTVTTYRPNNSQHCWSTNVGSCCTCLHVALEGVIYSLGVPSYKPSTTPYTQTHIVQVTPAPIPSIIQLWHSLCHSKLSHSPFHIMRVT